MLIDLVWKNLCSSKDSNYLVKGAELSQCLCGRYSRFAIVETRSLDAQRMPDVVYRVRDAEILSDNDVREGKRPPIVAEFTTLEEALAFVHETDGKDNG